jgi:hypothetical protein
LCYSDGNRLAVIPIPPAPLPADSPSGSPDLRVTCDTPLTHAEWSRITAAAHREGCSAEEWFGRGVQQLIDFPEQVRAVTAFREIGAEALHALTCRAAAINRDSELLLEELDAGGGPPAIDAFAALGRDFEDLADAMDRFFSFFFSVPEGSAAAGSGTRIPLPPPPPSAEWC